MLLLTMMMTTEMNFGCRMHSPATRNGTSWTSWTGPAAFGRQSIVSNDTRLRRLSCRCRSTASSVSSSSDRGGGTAGRLRPVVTYQQPTSISRLDRRGTWFDQAILPRMDRRRKRFIARRPVEEVGGCRVVEDAVTKVHVVETIRRRFGDYGAACCQSFSSEHSQGFGTSRTYSSCGALLKHEPRPRSWQCLQTQERPEGTWSRSIDPHSSLYKAEAHSNPSPYKSGRRSH